jgi:hypothetical protein
MPCLKPAGLYRLFYFADGAIKVRLRLKAEQEDRRGQLSTATDFKGFVA